MTVLDAPGLGFRVVMVGPGDYRVCPRGGVVGMRSFASATEAALSGLEKEAMTGDAGAGPLGEDPRLRSGRSVGARRGAGESRWR